MPTRIRLQRHGRKQKPYYFIVIADSRAKRDGKYIERIGAYNPNTIPATVELDNEKAFEWIMKGAQPSDTVRAILSYRGILYRKHLQRGVRKGAFDQAKADSLFQEWLTEQDKKIFDRSEDLKKKVASDRDARYAEEAKKREARKPVEEVLEEAPAENAEAPVVEEATTAPVETTEEAPKEEAPAAEKAKEETPSEGEEKKED